MQPRLHVIPVLTTLLHAVDLSEVHIRNDSVSTMTHGWREICAET